MPPARGVLLLLSLCALAGVAAAAVEDCAAFRAIANQSACDSCTAAALATAAALRACLLGGAPGPVFSPLQVWDCAGLPAAACTSGGVVLQQLVATLTAGAAADALLLPVAGAAVPVPAGASNASACYARAPRAGPLAAAAAFTAYWGASAQGAADARAALVRELAGAGPVVVELRLSAADFRRFAAWGGADGVFAATAAPGEPTPYVHSLVVHGWGGGAGGGDGFFWSAQNSFGAGWGAGGHARLDGALVSGAQWFAFTPPAPAAAAAATTPASTPTTAPPTTTNSSAPAATGVSGGGGGGGWAASALDEALIALLGALAGLMLMYFIVLPWLLSLCCPHGSPLLRHVFVVPPPHAYAAA